jgi:hypothetical protein
MARVASLGTKGGSREYEEIAKDIIAKGGVKVMSVPQISDTSKLIKEKMDIELKEIIDAFELKAEFFLTSNSLRKVWSHCFTAEAYRVPVDFFVQGFETTLGHEIVSSRSDPTLDSKWRETLTTLFKA